MAMGYAKLRITADVIDLSGTKIDFTNFDPNAMCQEDSCSFATRNGIQRKRDSW